MAPLALHRAASRVSGMAPAPRTGVVRVPRVVVFAQEPRFTLENSEQASEGFVEKDTAGQSNMYPTIMKPFEAGSAADTVKQDEFNNSIAVGGSVVALSAIAVGLVALLNAGGSSVPAAIPANTTYLSLSSYAAKFAEELAPAKPAPVAVAVPAPEVVVAVEEAPAVVEAVEAPAVVEAVASE